MRAGITQASVEWVHVLRASAPDEGFLTSGRTYEEYCTNRDTATHTYCFHQLLQQNASPYLESNFSEN